MKILNFIRNLFCTSNNLLSVSNDNENTVMEFGFYDDDNKFEIKLNGEINVDSCCFQFDDSIICDFDEYQSIELFFMVFDNTKLSIQNYADNYSELSKFFNSGKPPIDGILFFGRDLIDKTNIQKTLNAFSSESYILESSVYKPPSNELIEVNNTSIKNHICNLLSNELIDSSTSQMYHYSTHSLKKHSENTYVNPTAEIFCFGLIDPIIGVNTVSIKQGKINLVTGFRLTKVDSNAQEIHFTKNPLKFKLANEEDHHPNNMFSLKKDELDTLKKNESIESI